MIGGVIIPYRDRYEHLQISAPILSKVGNVYVIEQFDDKPFNRGTLFNIGYLEFKNHFNYFIAHDVDLVPVAADYSCCKNPCQLGTQIEQFDWRMPYPKYMGGVTLLPNDKFEQINGFSNLYPSYGGDDDELRRRFDAKGIIVDSRECKFKSLPHERNYDHEQRMKNAAKLREPIDWSDGLTSCRYEVVSCEDTGDYTLLKVNL